MKGYRGSLRVRLRVRGYGGGRLIFDEKIDVEERDLERIAEQQVNRLLPYRKNMVEIEFLDEPDLQERFLRFGSDKSRMVQPIEILLDPEKTS
jgi:hypothetical protein